MPFTDASYQESCEEAAQCTSRLGYQAVCKEGRCECQANNHYSVLDGRCIADVGEKITLIIAMIIIATGIRRSE
jgi:hypothetical protein